MIFLLLFRLPSSLSSYAFGFGNFLTTTKKIHQSVQINFHFKVYSLGANREIETVPQHKVGAATMIRR